MLRCRAGGRLLAASMAVAGRVLVYGGRGALGSQCVQYFKSRNWVRAGRERDGVRGGGGWAVGRCVPRDRR